MEDENRDYNRTDMLNSIKSLNFDFFDFLTEIL